MKVIIYKQLNYVFFSLCSFGLVAGTWEIKDSHRGSNLEGTMGAGRFIHKVSPLSPAKLCLVYTNSNMEVQVGKDILI